MLASIRQLSTGWLASLAHAISSTILDTEAKFAILQDRNHREY